jgi:hypothetical protein
MFEQPNENRPFRWRWWWEYPIHALLAPLVPIILGTALDQHFYDLEHQNILAGVAPCSALIALGLGYTLNRFRAKRRACLVFLPWLALFVNLVLEEFNRWSPERTTATRAQFVIDNVFGVQPGCEGDCAGGIFSTLFSCSLAYSIGASLALWQVRSRKQVVPSSSHPSI